MNKVEALIPFKVTLLACVILRAENVTRNLIPELQLRVEFILPLLIEYQVRFCNDIQRLSCPSN